MSKQAKHLVAVLAITAGIFLIWEMFKAWRAGVSAVGSIIMAPFTAAKAVWSAIVNFAGGIGTASKPNAIGGTNQTPAELLGVDPNTALGQMLNNESGQINMALLSGTSSTPSTSSDQVIGIWGTAADLSKPSP